MNRIKIGIWIFIFSSFLNSSNAQTAQELINDSLSIAYKKSSLPGFAVAMVTKDKILYQEGFGYADLQKQTPFTINTVENIGSISKTLIGLSLMKAVERGQLKLDDPVNKYLPFKVVHPRFPEIEITIRHLATHNSGIKDRSSSYFKKSYYFKDELNKKKFSKKGFSIFERWYFKKIKNNKELSLKEYLGNVLLENGEWYSKKNFTKYAPGTNYEYSNVGATLAAFVLEEVTGMPYDKFAETEIINPLKLNASGWKHQDVDLKNWATHYMGKKNAILPFYDLTTYPDGSFKSSVVDMSTYLQAMLKGYAGEGDFLKTNSFETLFKNNLSKERDKQSGIFWDVFGTGEFGDIGHGGSDPGITTLMYFSPKTQIGKIIITNCSGKEKELFAIWEQFIKMETLFLN